MVNTKCKAKNPEACSRPDCPQRRLHAEKRFIAANKEYIRLHTIVSNLKAVNANILPQTQRQFDAAEQKFEYALGEWDAQPDNLEHLRSEVKMAEELQLSNYKSLKARLNKAEQFPQKKTKTPQQRKKPLSAYEKFVQQQNELEAGEPQWKKGYNAAVAALFTDTVERDVSWEPAEREHLNKCGTYRATNIYDTSESYNHYNSYGDAEAQTKHEVQASMTCNCGKILRKNTYYQGTLGDLFSTLLS